MEEFINIYTSSSLDMAQKRYSEWYSNEEILDETF